MNELSEHGSTQVEVTGKPVAALLDEGVIGRWARLFAARYRTPERAEELSARIVGAIAGEPQLARRVIASDEDLDAAFQFARSTVEAHVGASVFTVAGSVRAVVAHAASQASGRSCPTRRGFVAQHVA